MGAWAVTERAEGASAVSGCFLGLLGCCSCSSPLKTTHSSLIGLSPDNFARASLSPPLHSLSLSPITMGIFPNPTMH